MTSEHQEEVQTPFVFMGGKRLVQIVLLGAAVGLLVYGLTFILDTYILRALLCQGNQTMQCVPSRQYGEVIATLLGAGIGLFGLVKLQVFRSLIVAMAATMSLWGLVSATAHLPWLGAGLGCIALYAIAYVLFAWIARIRLFWLVLILALVLVAAIRFTLAS